jgi:glycyl-tRNA synthetase beta chain
VEKGPVAPLLLEIGTEEIPARFIPQALSQLRELTGKALGENRIRFGETGVYGTPRRLAVIVSGVEARQEDSLREAFGPPKKAAFMSDGTLTKAALGFAASVGVDPDKLVVKAKGKGEYVAAVVEEKGLPSVDVLPELLKKVVLSLSFPKSMRWGDGSLRFARPIHWIVALYGSEALEFEIDGLRSGDTTRGHRFLSPGAIRIKNAAEYQAALKNNLVIADQEKRQKTIWEQAEELAKSAMGSPIPDEDLLQAVTNLVEYPAAVLGSFDEKYLRLPEELLIAVMKGHQKYFSVADGRGKLNNFFIVISNTKKENAETVRAGAERVIRARLEDARFYFEEDRKRPLIDRLEELKKVTYQEKLGSLYDKTMRVKKVCELLARKLNLGINDCEGLQKAAELSKCDLITGVVREFPELQGLMGMYYIGGLSHVAFAIRDQYHPAYSGDYVPGYDIGAVLGLADRMDNIASFFSIGLIPTGSEDPFALRRQAIAIIDMLLKKGYSLSVKEILDPALSNLGHIPESKDARAEILRFFEQRIEPLLRTQGYEFDLIQSVVSASTAMPLKELIEKLDALRAFKSHAGYGDFLTAIKRVRNIVPERELPAIDERLFREDAERLLYKAILDFELRAAVTSTAYAFALEKLASLAGPINVFFDGVLVMDKDEAVRDNRLSLLKEIWSLASSVADFSKLS